MSSYCFWYDSFLCVMLDLGQIVIGERCYCPPPAERGGSPFKANSLFISTTVHSCLASIFTHEAQDEERFIFLC